MQSEVGFYNILMYLTCIIKIFLSFEYPQIVRSEPKCVIINIEGRSIKIYIISENIVWISLYGNFISSKVLSFKKLILYFQLPEVSELFASYFGGGGSDKPKKKPAKPLRR